MHDTTVADKMATMSDELLKAIGYILVGIVGGVITLVGWLVKVRSSSTVVRLDEETLKRQKQDMKDAIGEAFRERDMARMLMSKDRPDA